MLVFAFVERPRIDKGPENINMSFTTTTLICNATGFPIPDVEIRIETRTSEYSIMKYMSKMPDKRIQE